MPALVEADRLPDSRRAVEHDKAIARPLRRATEDASVLGQVRAMLIELLAKTRDDRHRPHPSGRLR